MGKVTPIEANKATAYSEVICIGCGKRWVAVRPVSVLLKEIHCINCGPGKVIETGQPIDQEKEGEKHE